VQTLRETQREISAGPEACNIVPCEGAERIERHERLEKWRKIMEGKGFRGGAAECQRGDSVEDIAGFVFV
jgi:hypothetical protein